MKTRVAVLGGGPAGMAAAWELTATEDLRERYEVTVYQPGWRLGGKCASGRNRALGNRIEEHGLHLWFGFYDNGFSLMRRAYEELGRPAGAPLQTWRDAFKPLDTIVLFDQVRGSWQPRELRLPRNALEPGTPSDHTFGELCADVLGRLLDHWRRELLGGREGAHPIAPRNRPTAIARTQALRAAKHVARSPSARAGVHRRHRLLPWLLDRFRHWFERPAVQARMAVDADLRFFFQTFDIVAATVCGIVRDGIHGAANDVELRDWLVAHGASRENVDASPVLRALYDLVFAFEEGDTSRPNLAAGKAVQALIRIGLTYKGAVLWKMQAGMGDTVFTPLYEVLRHKRGVRFEFFSWVSGVSVGADGRSVERITVRPQARLREGLAEYEPLFDAKGLPSWPNEADWPQLSEADALRGADLEHGPGPLTLPDRVLERGRDFDVAVLALQPGGVPGIGDELAKHSPRFAEMVRHTVTVPTQAFQLWFDRPLGRDVGWRLAEDVVAGSYVEPLDTYCNMTQLLAREEWELGPAPKGVAYFCGVLPVAGVADAADADAHARASALKFLGSDVEPLWPGIASAGALDFSALIARPGLTGDGRFDEQFCHANWSGTSRYVLTTAGTVKHRLRAEESGFENLYLAGDWTRNGLCGGAVEAAVTSGMQAARAISGSPAVVPGLDGWLETD